jgi:hypothetical protein
MLAVSGMLSQDLASAAPQPVPDHESKQVFKNVCDSLKGTWSEGKFSTSCTYPDGDIEVCDENGKNCTYHPAAGSEQTPDHPLQDFGGPGGPDDTGGVYVEETPTESPPQAEIPSDANPTIDPGAGDGGSSAAVVQPTELPATEGAGTDSTAAAATVGSGEPTPAAGADAATLEIAVRRCEAGYDPYDPRARPDRECDEAAGGAEFRLVGKGLDLSGTAGPDGDGTIEFAGLVPGSYHLNQAPVPGIALAFVGACESNLRDFDDVPFFPLAIAGPNGDIGLRLRAGETLQCDWYQVPDAD